MHCHHTQYRAGPFLTAFPQHAHTELTMLLQIAFLLIAAASSWHGPQG